MFLEEVDVRSENETVVSDGPTERPESLRLDTAGAVELGIWLSGLESFLSSGHRSFFDQTSRSVESSREFRLVHAVLQRCSMLNARLMNSLRGSSEVSPTHVPDLPQLLQLNEFLRDSLLLSTGLIGSKTLGPGEWRAWAELLTARAGAIPAIRSLISLAEAEGRCALPEPLLSLVAGRAFLSPEHSELAMVLPRFGVILKWLEVVGRMLAQDEPLKPALVIFARTNEQIFELTNYINGRLEAFLDEEAELFSTLDAASYTASIELKKVYTQELAGIAQMRPTPSIYARIETAHALLSEGFQQLLAGFARIVDEEADIFGMFPSFRIKLDRSVTLRQRLWDLVNAVQAAEAKPDKAEIETMQRELRSFMNDAVKFLFFKDTETVERFVEEILITKQNKDLVPLLHRFGAYLETLFGQVSLRAVLEKHPFEPHSRRERVTANEA